MSTVLATVAFLLLLDRSLPSQARITLAATETTALYLIPVFIYEHNHTPSGKKTVTRMQVVTTSQVQIIGCKSKATDGVCVCGCNYTCTIQLFTKKHM